MNINNKINNFEEALKFLVKTKSGTDDDLKNNLTEEMIKELKLIKFIKRY